MTSLIALAWALEPSALSEPVGQARSEAEDDPPEVLLPGSAATTGSEPQAARLSVPRASTAASWETRVSRVGFAAVWSMVMRVLHETEGTNSPGGPGSTTLPGRHGRADPPDGWKVR